MTQKIFMVIFLAIIGFGYIQNEELVYKGYALWPRKTHMLEMKATFKEQLPSNFEESLTIEEQDNKMPEDVTQVYRNEDNININRVKRELGTASESVSDSIQSVKIESGSGSDVDPKSKPVNKRQAAVPGNVNRLKHLINLPINLNALVNILGLINQGLLHDKPLSSNSISGNDNNGASGLVNAPINADILANVLGILGGGAPSAGSNGQGNPLGILLGGGGGGGSGQGSSGLVNAPINANVLANVLGTIGGAAPSAGQGGPVGGLLGGGGASGQGQGGPLGGLLGGGGESGQGSPLGGLLGGGGGSGKGPGDNGLLGGLLGGSNGGLLGELLGDGQNSGLLGGLLGDSLGDLLGALLGSKGVVGKLLNGLDGGGLLSTILTNLLDGVVNLVDRLLELVTGLLRGLLVGMGSSNTGGSQNGSSMMNDVSRLQELVKALTLLKELLEKIKGSGAGGDGGTSTHGGISPGNNPNEICFDIPSQAGSSGGGNNNSMPSLINLPIDLNLDLNILGILQRPGGSNAPNAPTRRVCITIPKQPTTPTTAKPIVDPTLPPKNQICFYVWVDTISGTIVSSDCNQLSGNEPNLEIRRVCVPGTSAPISPFYPPLLPPIFPVTETPILPPGNQRCFKRTCTRWRHDLDYNCVNNPNEYPKYTLTGDVKK